MEPPSLALRLPEVDGEPGELITVPTEVDFPLCVAVTAEVWELGAGMFGGRVWIFRNRMVCFKFSTCFKMLKE